MSGQVTIRLPARRGGRRERAVAADVAPPERTPRVARVLALAHHWRELIRSGAVRDQADLARLVGVSRARVTQVVGLLDLAPDIQEALLFGEFDCTERTVRAVADMPLWGDQRRAWISGPRGSCPLPSARVRGRVLTR